MYFNLDEDDYALRYSEIAYNSGFKREWILKLQGDIHKRRCNFTLADSLFHESIKIKHSIAVMLEYAQLSRYAGNYMALKEINEWTSAFISKELFENHQYGSILDLGRLLSILNFDSKYIADIYNAGLQMGYDSTKIKLEKFISINKWKEREPFKDNYQKDQKDISDLFGVYQLRTYNEKIQLIEAFMALGAYNSVNGLIDSLVVEYKLSNYDLSITNSFKAYNSFRRYSISKDKVFLNESETLFYDALNLCPERIDISCNLAYINYIKNNLSSAEKRYLEINKINKDHIESLLGLSDIYSSWAEDGEMKYYLRANSYLHQALDVIKNNNIVYPQIGDIYFQLGYNYYKYLDTYGKYNIGPMAAEAAIDGYDYFEKSLDSRNDGELKFTLERLKTVRDSFLKNLRVKRMLIALLIAIMLIIAIVSLKKKSLLNKTNYVLAAPIIPLLVYIIFFWEVNSIAGIGLERRYNTEIIPVEMSGIKRIEIGGLIR